MKKLILAICTLLFVSCDIEDNIITEASEGITYTINNIEANSNDTIRCRYSGSTKTDFMYYDDNITFYDTIGKFKIGDKITARFIVK